MKGPHIQVRTTVKEPEFVIDRAIKKEIAKILTKKFIQISLKNKIQTVIRGELKEAIVLQPEYSSLVGKQLKADLGLLNADRRLDEIIDIWIQTLEVELIPFVITPSDFRGGIQIFAVKDDYDDVVNTNAAIQITEKGEELHWLLWLLKEGSKTLVSGYDVKYGFGTGRTNLAVMSRGGSFSIDRKFSGTSNNNFVIRAIHQMEPALKPKLLRVISDHVNN